MKKVILLFTVMMAFSARAILAQGQDDAMPVRGFCSGSPGHDGVDNFIEFIDRVLIPGRVNTLVFRIDYGYEFTSHPELTDDNALSREDVKKILDACNRGNIEVIPLVNLLGHQSWHGKAGKLLEVYPEFNETPEVILPEEYRWPNADDLYCLSYCPLHPGVHKVVFDLLDEIVDVFDAKSLHAGMDEVFYIGHYQCPLCNGKSKSALFAGEVSAVRDHLAEKGVELWIWGDRLIDGITTGIGIWEGSGNDTWQAIDMIPKDVVICDWHYEVAHPTASYFALKGFRVIECPWRRDDVAITQIEDLRRLRENSYGKMRDRYLGMMQTIWSSSERFMEGFLNSNQQQEKAQGDVDCYRALVAEWEKEK